MTRRVTLPVCGFLVLAFSGLGLPQPPKIELVASSGPLSPEDEKKAFKLPPGFEAQLVAAEPDISKPMNLAFDDRGRLWVTDTFEYPYPAAPDKKPRDTVKVLEDFGPDGRARKITTFADGLNIPIGLLPLPGAKDALVFAIPAIHKLSDTDGDGKADKRAVLYQKYGSRDTHGMTNAFTLGFDGWVYACHGFANDSTVVAGDGSKITMNSGNVYRFKVDGSRVEQITWGQVNPFGLSLDPLGNLYSADCHSMPIYQLLRGAYYPSFGKPHDGLGYGPMMMKHQHHSTGIAGITYYAADHFPKEYHGTLFIGNVVTSRVNHDRIEWKGSSPQAVERPDFLVSDDPWFRPVDIKLGPDGALYIADFYNCIIGHYEVPLTHPRRDRHRGRIWRIVYRGPDGKGKAVAPRQDWNKAMVKELIEDLGHPNLTVRMMATHQLATRKRDETVAAIKAVMQPSSNSLKRVHGLWILERLGTLDDDTLNKRIKDDVSEVRIHALRIMGERKYLTQKQYSLVVQGTKDDDLNVRRATAETLGRHPFAESIQVLIDLLNDGISEEDTHLRHVARIALRNQVRGDGRTFPTDAKLKGNRHLEDVALGISSKDAARYLLCAVEANDVPGDTIKHAEHIARYGDDDMVERLVALTRRNTRKRLRVEAVIYQSIERGVGARGGKLGQEARMWGTELAGRLLQSRESREVMAGMAIVGSLRLSQYQAQLTRLLDPEAIEGYQLAALEALASLGGEGNMQLFGKVLDGSERPFKVRQQAAVILGRVNSANAREALVKQLQTAPAAVQAVIAVALAGTPDGAEALLKSIENGKASARLLQDRTVATRLQEARLPQLDKRIAKLTEGLLAADQRIDELLKRRRDGYVNAKSREAMLGLKVFEKSCANCHQVGGKGQRVGPQLDGIGVRGLERLLEDTLDPSRNVDQAFRTTILNLKSGQIVRGLLLREEGGVLVMADDMGKEKRVLKDDVEERSVSQLSPMPANLADQIPETDFHHLLAYLLEQRAPQK